MIKPILKVVQFRLRWLAVRPQPGLKVCVVSIPKAGTNVLKHTVARCCGGSHLGVLHLERVTPSWKGRLSACRSALITTHEYDVAALEALKMSGWTLIFAKRDPRDILVSNFYYLKDFDSAHRCHKYLVGVDDVVDGVARTLIGLGEAPAALPFGDYLLRYLSAMRLCDCVLDYLDVVSMQDKAVSTLATTLRTSESVVRQHLEGMGGVRTRTKRDYGLKDWRQNPALRRLMDSDPSLQRCLKAFGYVPARESIC